MPSDRIELVLALAPPIDKEIALLEMCERFGRALGVPATDGPLVVPTVLSIWSAAKKGAAAELAGQLAAHGVDVEIVYIENENIDDLLYGDEVDDARG